MRKTATTANTTATAAAGNRLVSSLACIAETSIDEMPRDRCSGSALPCRASHSDRVVRHVPDLRGQVDRHDERAASPRAEALARLPTLVLGRQQASSPGV